MMKKVATLLVVFGFMCMFGFVTPVAYAYEGTSVTGIISDDTSPTNIRSGPGTGYAVIWTVSNGTAVDVYGRSGNWFKVDIGGKEGYVYRSLVKIETTSGVISDTTPTNVRSGPGTGYAVIGQLSDGTSVTIVGTSDDGKWKKIFYGDEIGYVYASLIESNSSTPSSTSDGESTSENRFDTVGSAEAQATEIVVDKSSHILTAYDSEGDVLLQCACSTGKAGYDTPSGTYRVTLVYSRDYTRISETGTTRTYSADDTINPFYVCIRTVNVETGKTQYIHGTGGWLLIGGNYSNGCIRIADANVMTLVSFLPREDTSSSSRVSISSGVKLIVK